MTPNDLLSVATAKAHDAPDTLVTLVLRAIAAERELCAKIADEEANAKCIDPYCCRPLAEAIADRIRSGQ